VTAVGTTAGAALAALLCLGTTGVCLALAAVGVGPRPAQLAHAAMGVGMAGMFSPWGDPLPARLGLAAFAVLGAWFAAAALRGDRADDGAVHLAVSSAAMALMYLLHGHAAPAGPGAAGGPHAGHVAAGGAAGLVVTPLALLLAGYFGWHAWICVHQARGPAGGAAGAVAVRAGTRAEPLVHGAMSVLMAAMFLGMA
jgi:hypothetical protein